MATQTTTNKFALKGPFRGVFTEHVNPDKEGGIVSQCGGDLLQMNMRFSLTTSDSKYNDPGWEDPYDSATWTIVSGLEIIKC